MKTRCAVCQYLYNLLLLLDLGVNTLLGGDPHESLSARTGRARAAGSRAAAAVCSALTWISNKVFRTGVGDHCTWAMAAQAINADEVWSWTQPVSILSYLDDTLESARVRGILEDALSRTAPKSPAPPVS